MLTEEQKAAWRAASATGGGGLFTDALSQINGRGPTSNSGLQEGDDFSAGMQSQWEGLKGLVDAAQGLGQEALGFEEAAQANFASAMQHQEKAGELSEFATVDSYKEVEGVGSAIDYTQYAVGSLLPTLFLGLGSGKVGALTGAAVVKKLAGKKMTEAALKAASQKAAVAGGFGGAYLSSLPLEAGETALGIFEETGEIKPGLSTAAGALRASFDALVPGQMLRKFGIFKGSAAEKEIAERATGWLASTGRLTLGTGKVAGKVAVGSLGEATTEAIQEAIGVAAVSWAADNDIIEGFKDPEQREQIYESFFRSFAGFLPVSGARVFVGSLDKKTPPTEPVDDGSVIADDSGGGLVTPDIEAATDSLQAPVEPKTGEFDENELDLVDNLRVAQGMDPEKGGAERVENLVTAITSQYDEARAQEIIGAASQPAATPTEAVTPAEPEVPDLLGDQVEEPGGAPVVNVPHTPEALARLNAYNERNADRPDLQVDINAIEGTGAIENGVPRIGTQDVATAIKQQAKTRLSPDLETFIAEHNADAKENAADEFITLGKIISRTPKLNHKSGEVTFDTPGVQKVLDRFAASKQKRQEREAFRQYEKDNKPATPAKSAPSGVVASGKKKSPADKKASHLETLAKQMNNGEPLPAEVVEVYDQVAYENPGREYNEAQIAMREYKEAARKKAVDDQDVWKRAISAAEGEGYTEAQAKAAITRGMDVRERIEQDPNFKPNQDQAEDAARLSNWLGETSTKKVKVAKPTKEKLDNAKKSNAEVEETAAKKKAAAPLKKKEGENAQDFAKRVEARAKKNVGRKTTPPPAPDRKSSSTAKRNAIRKEQREATAMSLAKEFDKIGPKAEAQASRWLERVKAQTGTGRILGEQKSRAGAEREEDVRIVKSLKKASRQELLDFIITFSEHADKQGGAHDATNLLNTAVDTEMLDTGVVVAEDVNKVSKTDDNRPSLSDFLSEMRDNAPAGGWLKSDKTVKSSVNAIKEIRARIAEVWGGAIDPDKGISLPEDAVLELFVASRAWSREYGESYVSSNAFLNELAKILDKDSYWGSLTNMLLSQDIGDIALTLEDSKTTLEQVNIEDNDPPLGYNIQMPVVNEYGEAFMAGHVNVSMDRILEKHGVARLVEVLLHEMVHSVTITALSFNPEFADTMRVMLHHARSHAETTGLVDKDAPNADKYTGTYYGLSNEFEMVAEAFTNPLFQKFLHEVELSAEEVASIKHWSKAPVHLSGVSLWRSFLGAVSKLFKRLDKGVKVLDVVLRSSIVNMQSITRQGEMVQNIVDKLYKDGHIITDYAQMSDQFNYKKTYNLRGVLYDVDNPRLGLATALATEQRAAAVREGLMPTAETMMNKQARAQEGDHPVIRSNVQPNVLSTLNPSDPLADAASNNVPPSTAEGFINFSRDTPRGEAERRMLMDLEPGDITWKAKQIYKDTITSNVANAAKSFSWGFATLDAIDTMVGHWFTSADGKTNHLKKLIGRMRALRGYATTEMNWQDANVLRPAEKLFSELSSDERDAVTTLMDTATRSNIDPRRPTKGKPNQQRRAKIKQVKADYAALTPKSKRAYDVLDNYYKRAGQMIFDGTLESIKEAYDLTAAEMAVFQGADLKVIKNSAQSARRIGTDRELTADEWELIVDRVYNAAKLLTKNRTGPYFPLHREGKYFVQVRQRTKHTAVTPKQAREFARGLRLDEPGSQTTKVVENPDGSAHFFHEIRSFELYESQPRMQKRRDELNGSYKKQVDLNKDKEAEGVMVESGLSRDINVVNPRAARFYKDIVTRKLKSKLSTANPESAQATMQAIRTLEEFSKAVLPEGTLAKRLMKRSNLPGASQDALQGLAKYGEALAWGLAEMKHGPKITDATMELSNVPDEYRGRDPQGQIKRQRVVEEIMKRTVRMDSKTPAGRAFASVGSKYATVMTLISLSFTMMQMVQPLMTTLPYLVKEYGFSGAVKKLPETWMMMTKPVFDSITKDTYGGAKALIQDNGLTDLDMLHTRAIQYLKESSSKEHADAIDFFVNMGDMDASASMVFANMAQGSNLIDPSAWDQTKRIANRFIDAGRVLPYTAEFLNRAASGLAAYDLAKSKLLRSKPPGYKLTYDDIVSLREAGAQAIRLTQFDYTSLNRFRYANMNAVTQVMSIFKMFPLGMYNLMFHMWLGEGGVLQRGSEGRSEATKEQRLDAAKGIATMGAVHMALAGAAGGILIEPIRLALEGIAQAAFDEDEPEDVQALVYLRNPELAAHDLFSEIGLGETAAEAAAFGLPRLVGVDTSQRLGLQNMLLMVTRGDSALDTVWQTISKSALGPVFGNAEQWDKLTKFVGEGGSILEGIERYALPKLMRDFVKGGYGIRERGITDWRGNKIANPEDFSQAELLQKMIVGFSTATEARIYQNRSIDYMRQGYFRQGRQKLLREYRDATPAERGKIIAEVGRYNKNLPVDVRKRYRITPDSLKRSLKNRRERERMTVDGVYTPRR